MPNSNSDHSLNVPRSERALLGVGDFWVQMLK